MEWYVARDGETYGPFSLDEMRNGVRSGELRAEDLVWSSVTPDWVRASEIVDFWIEKPILPIAPVVAGGEPAPAKPEVDASSTPKSQSNPSRANLVVRHWRGELSLAQAYWGIGLLLSVGVIALATAIGKGLSSVHINARAGSAILVVFLLLLSVFAVWQVIGIWRAAGNHIARTGKYFWACAVRLVVIISVIRGGADFVNVLGPMLSESSKVAMGVENTPAYQLRLLRAATEVELSGGMPFGTAAGLKSLLDAAPTVKIIHLNSFGGRVGEGYEVYKIVRQRGLITYTSTNCVSACTIAFLAGTDRFLASGGKLGFHSANFGGLDEKVLPEINAEIRQTLKLHGVAQWFIEKALTTRGDSVWYPTHNELIEAGVVTKIVDSAQFGFSGIAQWKDRDAIERDLTQIPIYAVMKENDPEGFKALATRYSDGVQAGRSINEIVQEVQTTLTDEVLPRYLQTGPDVELIAYWKSQIAEMEYLNKTDATRCVEFLFPELRQKDFNLTKLVPDALVQQDLGALAALVRATAQDPVRGTGVNVEEDVRATIDRMSAENPQANQVLLDPQKYLGQPKLVCTVLTSFYQQVLALPPDRSGPMLRELASK